MRDKVIHNTRKNVTSRCTYCLSEVRQKIKLIPFFVSHWLRIVSEYSYYAREESVEDTTTVIRGLLVISIHNEGLNVISANVDLLVINGRSEGNLAIRIFSLK